MEKGLKILMIGSDRKLFEDGSAVSERIKEYGKLVEELHVVVFTLKSLGLVEKHIAPNVWIYPTNSISRWLYPVDAVKIGRKIDATIITAQDPFESGWAGLRLKKILKIPLEAQLHTDPFSSNFSGMLNNMRKVIMKKVAKSADAIRVVRPSLKTKIIAKYDIDENKISILPIYIDRKRFYGEPKFNLHERFKSKYVVLTVSRLSKEKNINIIISAMRKVKDAILVIVGDGPERVNLENMAQHQHLEVELPSVVFEGWQEDLNSYYKTADLLVQASDFEGYGLSIVEAALCGLLSVSTPTGIAEDLDGVVKANNTETFAERINYLLHHEEERKGLGEKLKEAIKIDTETDFLTALKNNWEKLAKL
ncbi:MAG: glycosyltransferase family 4 protein [Candidatus Zambryskibacteria bacterium]|nr:glycosyltransferase family 4 protein [Candidatus Zambryskibacteria bacterium]